MDCTRAVWTRVCILQLITDERSRHSTTTECSRRLDRLCVDSPIIDRMNIHNDETAGCCFRTVETTRRDGGEPFEGRLCREPLIRMHAKGSRRFALDKRVVSFKLRAGRGGTNRLGAVFVQGESLTDTVYQQLICLRLTQGSSVDVKPSKGSESREGDSGYLLCASLSRHVFYG
ncbi:hypothetical protein M378DRAFT_182549 [Amanita muscaria Koide BX008]|uniref:Uncharacterized protein n=1 Tax=Amanita muscaria (strain Koide BX008) TaxID=946122 RepID=A0A0C2RW01_AMAMK|nr:hypothetical protein M378DRAFT_182549 [Amanita muscaria Koide BX008]